MGVLLLLFIVVPAIEVTILAQIVGAFGGINTLILVVLTGIIGAALAKQQGFSILSKIQAETASGRMPVGSLVDGAIILVAGALLVTPGVLTDAFGFACLVPAFRTILKRVLEAQLAKRMVIVQRHAGVRPPANPGGPIIDVTPGEPE